MISKDSAAERASGMMVTFEADAPTLWLRRCPTGPDPACSPLRSVAKAELLESPLHPAGSVSFLLRFVKVTTGLSEDSCEHRRVDRKVCCYEFDAYPSYPTSRNAHDSCEGT